MAEMDVREKLVELIDQKQVYGIDKEQPRKHDILLMDNDELADHLITHGVTVQEWISVKDRLPELYTTTYEHENSKGEKILEQLQESDYVTVYTADGKVSVARYEVWEDRHRPFWIDAICATPEVTHWMPLPEPPKGE